MTPQYLTCKNCDKVLLDREVLDITSKDKFTCTYCGWVCLLGFDAEGDVVVLEAKRGLKAWDKLTPSKEASPEKGEE